MAQPKKRERVTVNGVEYLVLHRSAILKDLDVTIIKTYEDVNLLMSKLRHIVHGAELWYWVETGFALVLDWDDESDEYVWCVVDNNDSSTRYTWLSTKARKFANSLVKRLNESGRDLLEANKLVAEFKEGTSSGTET